MAPCASTMLPVENRPTWKCCSARNGGGGVAHSEGAAAGGLRETAAHSFVHSDGNLPRLVLQAQRSVLVSHEHAQHDGNGRRASGESVDRRQLQ